MRVFLCSSPTREMTPELSCPMLDERNGFLDRLWKTWPDSARCLMIAADPEDYEGNDEMTDHYRQAVCNAGFPVACFDLWDARHPGFSREAFGSYDVVFLAGGHIFTEWAWFSFIRLRKLLRSFHGILIGTSAGSMNAAGLVYACPEQEGESELPEKELFYRGLGLTRCMLVPHYQKVYDMWLDGRPLIDDIVRSHSIGRRFLVVPDGTYVLVEKGKETVHGEAWLMENGEWSRYCREGEQREC